MSRPLLTLFAAPLLALLAARAEPPTKGPPGRFVAVGHHGLRLSSPDGLAWGHAQVGKEGEIYRAVAYGNGRFVAVGTYGGDNLVASTADGASWQAGKKEAGYVRFLRGLGFGDGTFLALGGDPGAVGDSRPFVMQTADGLTWSDQHAISGKNILRRVAYGNGRFVAVGDRGRRATSADGKAWTDAPAVKATDTLIDVAFGRGRFVGVGLHGLRMTSADGLTWENRQSGEEGEHLNSVVWADDRFVAVGAGATYASPDGLAWQRRANADAPLTVAYGNGAFLGARWRGRIMYSTDAVTWKQVHVCEHQVESIAYGGR